jgi:hypothetical protein
MSLCSRKRSQERMLAGRGDPLQLARALSSPAKAGLQAIIARRIICSINSRRSHPIVRAAATAARDLTIEQFRMQ